MTSAHVILCLNSGSSSRKFALYRIGDQAEALIAEGAAERVGLKQGQLWIRDAQRKILLDARRDFPHPAAAVQAIFAELERLKLPNSEAVGHRLVHGGPNHVKPQRVTAQLIAALNLDVTIITPRSAGDRLVGSVPGPPGSIRHRESGSPEGAQ